MYLIGLGHDQPLANLVPFWIAPQTPGLLHATRRYAASGAVIDELPHVPFHWPLYPEEEDYRIILAQCGLLVAKTALVTVQIQDENYDWVLRNGTAVKPEVGKDGQRSDFFLRGFTILVKYLRVLA